VHARRLILIRHSVPQIYPEVPPAAWHLSADGIARARAFASRVDPGTADRIFTSSEPKAVETATALGEVWNLPLEEAPGLHEHERPQPRMLSREHFESQVGELFARPAELVFGAETANSARVRFVEAVLRLVRRTDRDVVIVSHGTVIALFVAAHSDLEAFTFWRQQQMPDGVSFDLPGLTLRTAVTQK
jgi:broad specificity phosphatase PhoE